MFDFAEFALFRDRADAGQRLASQLAGYANRPDVVVLALPHGGVPVAFEIARALNVPLDVFVVRKLGVPGYREIALGAIASGGVQVIDDQVVHRLGVPSSVINDIAAAEIRELERQERLYRTDRSPLPISDHTVIVVDDGMATGSSMRAAVAALRMHEPARIVVAVPVAPPDVCDELRPDVEEIVCLSEPKWFVAVGQWYENFRQVTDQEVQYLLAKAPALLNPVSV
jgi:predicted phosphoribosyltransferase